MRDVKLMESDRSESLGDRKSLDHLEGRLILTAESLIWKKNVNNKFNIEEKNVTHEMRIKMRDKR